VFTHGDRHPKYIGKIDNPDAVLEWASLDRVTRDAREAERSKGADAKNAELGALVARLRVVYWRLSPSRRALWLTRLVYEITKGV